MDHFFRRMMFAALLCLGALAVFISAPLKAATYGPSGYTQYSAQQACREAVALWDAGNPTNLGGCTGPYLQAYNYYQACFPASCAFAYNVYNFAGAAMPCAQPDWMNADGTCGTPSTPEDCEALTTNPDFQNDTASTMGYESKCVGGCNFAATPSEGIVKTSIGGTVVAVNGVFRFTGSTCTVTPDTPPKETVKVSELPIQTCVPDVNGQSFCVKADGQHCYAASSGKHICFQPTELGKKYDGQLIQQRVLGIVAGTAPTVPGGTVTASGTGVVTSVQSGTTTTTNTTNNYTVTGVTLPSTNDATPTAGDSASGGSCSSSYVCSGDTLKCSMLEEARKTRCAVEHGNEGITGGTTCATDDPPVCTGPTCNASAYSVVLQQYKGRCAAEALGTKADAGNGKLDALITAVEGIDAGGGGASGGLGADVDMPGDDDAAQGEGGTAAGNGHGEEVEYGADGLDGEGMGFDRGCPDLSFDFNGTHYAPDMFWICTAGEIESYIMLLIVAFLCLRYIGSA